MNTNDELLPCPFCGSVDLRVEEIEIWKWIVCNDCKKEGPFDLGFSGAKERWNERAVINETK